jgi:peptidoglycan hydrolase-like protein with peptidoglycan-binding domain
MMSKKLKTLFLIAILFWPIFIFAESIDEEKVFNVDSFYDWRERKEINSVLAKTTSKFYFYVDKEWWAKLSYFERENLYKVFSKLNEEFERKIYPTLTSNFGKEPDPGIDNDSRLTILIHPMSEDYGGYISTGDLYPKIIYPKSNEREMIYLNSSYIGDFEKMKGFLAHEFLHLIGANQKDLLRNVTEETWLNEARAEYAFTLLDYDKNFEGSNLERRVKDILKGKNDSLTEWLNKKEDYAVVNLFVQYLVDHYGLKILADSLKSSYVGIPSLNYALKKNGYSKDFSQIFTDWLITLFLNDCQISSDYCYLNENLKNLKISPAIFYLPPSPESILTVYTNTKEWAGNWQKIIGGKGKLVFKFEGKKNMVFKIPYLLCDYRNSCQIKFLELNKEGKGELEIEDFGSNYDYLVVIPSIQTKMSGFNGNEETYSFSWTVSIYEKKPEEKAEIEKLLAQIEELKRKIAEYQEKIQNLLAQKKEKCTLFAKDLYFGMTNSFEVRCLQEFLKNQGPEIYPEGLVTGNFLSLTQAAVIRFQEKYASEILHPLNLQKGTGYVGPATRAKINQLLGF